MTKFAAHGPFAIYAVGTTEAEAMANAQEYAPGAGFAIGTISDELYQQIEAEGWNPNIQSFTTTGPDYKHLVETTDA